MRVLEPYESHVSLSSNKRLGSTKLMDNFLSNPKSIVEADHTKSLRGNSAYELQRASQNVKN